MSDWKPFGGTPADHFTFPQVGNCGARCLYLMLNIGPLSNEKLREYGMGNASRRAKDLVENHGVHVMTRTVSMTRPDGVSVRVSEYRVDPEWINRVMRESEALRGRLVLWADAQEKYEQKRRAAQKEMEEEV